MDALLLTYPTLSHNGFPCRWEGRQDFKEARIEFIRAVIRKSIAPARCYDVGSYGGKHYVEHLTGSYLTNGEFIVAMKLEGYTHSKVVAGCPNVSFKAKYVVSPDMVANVGRNIADETIFARHWGGQKKVQAYKTLVAEVKALVNEVKGDKERVEHVIGYD